MQMQMKSSKSIVNLWNFNCAVDTIPTTLLRQDQGRLHIGQVHDFNKFNRRCELANLGTYLPINLLTRDSNDSDWNPEHHEQSIEVKASTSVMNPAHHHHQDQ
jgi:hypothetical protein